MNGEYIIKLTGLIFILVSHSNYGENEQQHHTKTDSVIAWAVETLLISDVNIRLSRWLHDTVPTMDRNLGLTNIYLILQIFRLLGAFRKGCQTCHRFQIVDCTVIRFILFSVCRVGERVQDTFGDRLAAIDLAHTELDPADAMCQA